MSGTGIRSSTLKLHEQQIPVGPDPRYGGSSPRDRSVSLAIRANIVVQPKPGAETRIIKVVEITKNI